jgi:sugar phosphate permease
VRYTLLFWLPLFLNQHLGFSAPQAGVAATAFDVGGQ